MNNDWFCPLIKMDCNPRCICYRPKEIVVEKVNRPEHCTKFMGSFRFKE